MYIVAGCKDVLSRVVDFWKPITRRGLQSTGSNWTPSIESGSVPTVSHH